MFWDTRKTTRRTIMAINPNTDFSSGAVLTAAQQNRFPRGVMGGVVRTAGDIALTTTVADLTGMSITFTAVASRTYKCSWSLSAAKSTASGYVGAYLTNSSNTVLAASYATGFIVAGAGYVNLSGFTYLTTLSAGSTTLKLRGNVESAGGTVIASGTNAASFIIEDCGPS